MRVVAHQLPVAFDDDTSEVARDDPVGDGADQTHVVLDEQDAGAGDVADAQQQRTERLGLALRDARRWLVEQDHLGVDPDLAREVDDPAASGREVGDELVAVVVETHHRDQLVGTLAELPLGAQHVREVEHLRDRVPVAQRPVDGDADRLMHGEAAEQTGVLERTGQSEARAPLRLQARDVAGLRA